MEKDVREPEAIIRALLDALRDLIVQNAAQATALHLLCDDDEARILVEHTKAELVDRVGGKFERLRGMFLSQHPQSPSPPPGDRNWLDAVRELVESAKDVDLSEE